MRRALMAIMTSRYWLARVSARPRALTADARSSQAHLGHRETRVDDVEGHSGLKPRAPRQAGSAASSASRVRHLTLLRGWMGLQPDKRRDGLACRTRARSRRPGGAVRQGDGHVRDLFDAPRRRSARHPWRWLPRPGSSSKTARGIAPSSSLMAMTAAPVSIDAERPRRCDWRTTTAPALRARS